MLMCAVNAELITVNIPLYVSKKGGILDCCCLLKQLTATDQRPKSTIKARENESRLRSAGFSHPARKVF